MKNLIVSPAPHIHGRESTQRIMLDVIIALMPLTLTSLYFFGNSSLILILTSIITAIALEYLIQKFLLKVKTSIGDLSAVVTGLLLALNLPPAAPWWIAVIGSFVAIGVAKMTFGGIGQNLFNPALVGRVFLLVSFPVIMTEWSVPESWFNTSDAFSGATPLAIVKEGLAGGKSMEEIFATNNYSYSQMLFSRIGGSLGEISVFSVLAGFVYLLIRKVIKPIIPLTILATVFIIASIFYLIDSSQFTDPGFQLLTGGIMIGSIFMATDYTTSPMNNKGMFIFAIGIGFLTIMIRYFGAYPEGISFAILIMNATVPLLNTYFKPKKFGKEVKNG